MDAIEDGVDDNNGETLLFVERDVRLVEVAKEVIRIGVVEGLQRGFKFIGAAVALVFSCNSIPSFSIIFMFGIVT